MTKDRKKLIKKLDGLCRSILLKRDLRYGQMFRCISCQKLYPVNVAQVGHYISRRYESVRWDLRNIHLQCASCNKWLNGNSVEYRKSLVNTLGNEEVEKIEMFYQESPHYSTFDLAQLVIEYKNILNTYFSAEDE